MPTNSAPLTYSQPTYDQHVRSVHIAFGELLSSRKAVYLDINFWIDLLDAAHGRGKPGFSGLLTLLREGAHTGLLFCPISEAVFAEVMKQGDRGTRNATAELINELSVGATLMTQRERMRVEISHFFRTTIGPATPYPLEHLVWTKPIFAFGAFQLDAEIFDSVDGSRARISFFDYIWRCSLAQQMECLADDVWSAREHVDLANLLTSANAQHAGELTSFKEAYSTEVRGIVDLTDDMILDVLDVMARQHGVVTQNWSAAQKKAIVDPYKNLLALTLEDNKSRQALRTIHTLASLHSSLRWNKGRKFKTNDLFDFDHAAAAVPYCDAFFTEGSLRTLITAKHVALDQRFNCHIASTLEDAMKCVQKILDDN